MNNFIEKINKLSLPVAILIVSIILGGFYFGSQIIKQNSIEKQQQIKIEQERQIREEMKELLDDCLFDANIIDDSECRSIFQTRVCLYRISEENEAKINAYKDKSRDECFKKYPQK